MNNPQVRKWVFCLDGTRGVQVGAGGRPVENVETLELRSGLHRVSLNNPQVSGPGVSKRIGAKSEMGVMNQVDKTHCLLEARACLRLLSHSQSEWSPPLLTLTEVPRLL